MNIKLPSIKRVIYNKKGSKNFIVRLIDVEKNFSATATQLQSGVLEVVSTEGEKFIFTNNKNLQFESNTPVLLTDLSPTSEKFLSGVIKIRKWLYHPNNFDLTNDKILESWMNAFTYKEESSSQDTQGLRTPQLAAVHAILGHLTLPLNTGTVVMPTGTGKTETMISGLVAAKCKKLLITVPSDALRDQIAEKFITFGILKRFGVIAESALYPKVGVIKNKFSDQDELIYFLDQCNVVVTTMSWLTSQDDVSQNIIANSCSHIFIDEAHHIKAKTWSNFTKKFSKEQILQFTATPFRNDGKRLDGDIIFNFPLKKAQEQGYYKTIEFVPIREYDSFLADEKIAKQAVERLRADLKNGYHHILMARCSTKQRANEIFKYYEMHRDLNPIVIYSNCPNFNTIYKDILKREHKIIVCVDMLGEGFDLPELKVAAFHDIRKSLPITLQLAGRFTRTSFDRNLGTASFFANIADLNVRSELEDLYAVDADWNKLLSDSSFGRIEEEVEFKNFIDGFGQLNNSKIPFQNILTKMSTVVFKTDGSIWAPNNFMNGIPGYENFDFKFYDINLEKKVLIIVIGRKLPVEWIHDKGIYNIQWDLFMIYYDEQNKLLYIHSSDKSSVYSDLAKAVVGARAELIKGVDVFKTFFNLKRVRLQNVGLRQFYGKNIRFRMMIGADVAEALSLAEKQRGEKAFVTGTGYEDGNPVSIGASYKGRIWAKLRADLKEYLDWCDIQGKKLIDDSIDPNQILKETLIPDLITVLPQAEPVWIDWDVDMYAVSETKYKFIIGGKSFDLSNLDIRLQKKVNSDTIYFTVQSGETIAEFKFRIFSVIEEGITREEFSIELVSSEPVEVQYGSRSENGSAFFHNYIPTIWFADGSSLTGNEYIKLKNIGLYPKEMIEAWDWSGVDLAKESQGVTPKIQNSIQANVIQKLKNENFDIIYDDDYAGEIADIVAIKRLNDKITVNLYHLKYAIDGVVGNNIKNLYEICGQVQKSVHWKHKSGKDFISHLLRRKIKAKGSTSCSRLEKGDEDDLMRLMSVMKNKIPVEFQLFLIQPAISKSNVSDAILSLLSVTEMYVKETANVNLTVVGSS